MSSKDKSPLFGGTPCTYLCEALITNAKGLEVKTLSPGLCLISGVSDH